MPVVSENEGQNFEEKARRGQEIMDSLHKLSRKSNKTEEEKTKDKWTNSRVKQDQ